MMFLELDFTKLSNHFANNILPCFIDPYDKDFDYSDPRTKHGNSITDG